MAVNAHDVQICLWKMLKLSSNTCINASINHPYVSCSLFFSFLLYVFFPLVFWILVYSTPIVVCSCIALSILRKPRENVEGDVKTDQNYINRKKAKFATERVHSVRRRRAKEIMSEVETKQNNTPDEQDEIMRELEELAREQQEELLKQNFLLQQDEHEKEHEKEDEKEEEKEVSTTNNNCNDCVDKSALLVEETLKEIREVEQVHSPPQTPLKLEKNENEETNEEDHKNNKMDIGISDTERTKRLESLIARRRSRKMLNFHVRNSLMNKEKNKEHAATQMPSLIIPRINTNNPNRISGPFSPGPGSAPSILIPMRNPFDLPYDPMEEKPILTGDSFDQEFTLCNNPREIVFSRHESFSLGPSLSSEYFRNRGATSSGRDYGYRRAAYRFSRASEEFKGRDFSPLMEQKSYKASESKLSMDSPSEDQIKEIIRVDENESRNDSEESNGESETRQIPQSDFNSSSSSPSSSEEDQPLFKIDREAVLKSLSSMRRNALLEIENNEEGLGKNLSYANSALENATRLKQQYYDDNKPMKHHAISYSIASDMQVEVSEVSSPPLTIDENMNDDGTERNHHLSWGSDRDLWDNEINRQDAIDDEVSRIETTEDDSLSDTTDQEKYGVQSELSDNGEDQEPEQHVEDQQSSDDHGQLDAESNDQQAQYSTISPKSVLIPTLSLSNLDQATNEEPHQSAPNAAESSSPANVSPESVNDESKIQENNDHSQETSSRSINDSEATSNQNDQTQMVSTEATHDDDRQTNSTISNSFDETKQVQHYDLSKSMEGNETNREAHQSTPHITESSSPNDELKIQENDDQSQKNSSRSIDATSANDSEAMSNQNDQSEDHMVIREATQDDERQTNSTSSNSFDETKQVQANVVSELVEGNETNIADHREDEGETLLKSITSIDNDNK